MPTIPYYARHFDIEKGDVIVNLGACVGKATLYFSNKAGYKGVVIAVEPVVENYMLLSQVILNHKLCNVIPLLTAIWETTGRAQINLAHPKLGYVSHSLVFERTHGKRVVPTISWNDLVELCGLSHVNLMKMDIEGGECEVLRGMTNVLPNKIVMEEHIRKEKDPEKKLQEIYSLLEEKGYTITVREHCYIYARRGE